MRQKGAPVGGRIFKDAGYFVLLYLAVPSNSAIQRGGSACGISLTKDGQDILWKNERPVRTWSKAPTCLSRQRSERQGRLRFTQIRLRSRENQRIKAGCGRSFKTSWRANNREGSLARHWDIGGRSDSGPRAAAARVLDGLLANGPGEPIVYTLNHYRNIFTDSLRIKPFETVGFAATRP